MLRFGRWCGVASVVLLVGIFFYGARRLIAAPNESPPLVLWIAVGLDYALMVVYAASWFADLNRTGGKGE